MNGKRKESSFSYEFDQDKTLLRKIFRNYLLGMLIAQNLVKLAEKVREEEQTLKSCTFCDFLRKPRMDLI